ncbi:MAG: segregation and condensation protein A [Planctomycetaceae bacterium]|jgi:segregation and condensation protein A
MSQQDLADYRVELDGFCGPLDLLLYLVRREEVDILDLPMAVITAQFVEFLEVLQILDLDFIGEFVVVASTLVEIKSRMVLPQEEVTPEIIERDEDPRSELVQQLLEYKRFKEASQQLEEQAAQWQQRYPRLSDDRPNSSGDPSQDLFKEVELWDLVSALSRVLRKNSEAAPTKVIYDDTPIAVYIEQIKQRVDEEGRCTFSSFFAGAYSRSRITGIFLAILELLRHQKYRAEQPIAYREIWILPPLEQTQTAPTDETSTTSADTRVAASDTALLVEPAAEELVPAAEVAVEPVAEDESPVILQMPAPAIEGNAVDAPPPATGTEA